MDAVVIGSGTVAIINVILTIRGSHRRCSVKKGVVGNFTKFTGKHLCRSLFFNKVAGLRLCDTLD